MDENYQTNLDANYFFKLKHSVSRDKSSILMLVRVRYASLGKNKSISSSSGIFVKEKKYTI